MRWIIPLLCFIMPEALMARDTTEIQLDERLAVTNKPNDAVYTAKVVKQNGRWLSSVYYGQWLAFTGQYKDKRLTIRDGWFTFYFPYTSQPHTYGRYNQNMPVDIWQHWYENGQKRDSGLMEDGKKSNFWKEWHPNGRLKSQGEYLYSGPATAKTNLSAYGVDINLVLSPLGCENDTKHGIWLSWHHNGRMKDSVAYDFGKKEGACKIWFSNGITEATGIYRADKEQGLWRWYYPGGQPRTEETWDFGKLQALKCFDTAGLYTGDVCTVNRKTAFIPGADTGFYNYIIGNVNMPGYAPPGPGCLYIQFTITTAGAIEDIVVENAFTPAVEIQIRRALAAMPAWAPAVLHNMTASAEYNCRIAGKLQPGIYYNPQRPQRDRQRESRDNIILNGSGIPIISN